MKRLIIIGIGQELRGDDAVGIAVVREWAVEYPKKLASPQIEVDFLPLPGLALLDHISGFETAILVDAVLGGPGVRPGSLLNLSPEDLVSFTRGTGSAHGWGVAESLRLGRTLKQEDLPEKIIILGIGGKQVDLGAKISPEVAEAIPEAVQMLDHVVEEILRG
ncbi:MAG: hydrogenase maturation protease [Anaerolineales bacterium]|nr:hydrogenase maturation protease [Anaerolineales bacterium]